MENESKTQDNLNEEFKELGKNLVSAVRSAWESPGWKNLQGEIEIGLSEFGSTIKNEVETIKGSPTAQQIKSDVENLHERYNTGEVEAKVRQDLLTTLRSINNELENISRKISGEEPNNEEQTQEEGGDIENA